MWIHLHGYNFIYYHCACFCGHDVYGWMEVRAQPCGLVLSHFYMNSCACVASSFTSRVIFQLTYSLPKEDGCTSLLGSLLILSFKHSFNTFIRGISRLLWSIFWRKLKFFLRNKS